VALIQRPDALEVVVDVLGTLILKRMDDGAFRRVGPMPQWVDQGAQGPIEDPAAAFPFLETFLEQAEAVWRAPNDGEVRSGFWTQSDAEGRSVHLTARAMKRGPLCLLTVASDEDTYRDHQLLAQRGRESSLALERLYAEIQKKEILVHTIVHDLAVPVNVLTGSLGVIQESRSRIPPDLQALVDSAARGAQRQARLIREILDAFAAEQEDLAHVERSPERAPNALSAAQEALQLMEREARAKEITLQLRVEPAGADWRVVGDKSRLERIFMNLVENAARYSPKCGTVTVSLTQRKDRTVIAVEDEGPGVPKEVRPLLFEKFIQGRGRTGRMGLGLYFCAITVRRWGGTIAYETAPKGGARFVIELVRPSMPTVLLSQPPVNP
jgi:signal transduction histidine kinase